MLKIEELESILVNAMNTAIEQGYLLICNDWGVCWDDSSRRWIGDSSLSQTLCCDIFGALLLAQPPIDATLHRGDPDRAARMVVDPDFYASNPAPDLETLFDSVVYELCRNISNGWDSEEFLGGDDAAYLLGQRLADIYQPLSAEVLALGHTRTRSARSLDDFPDEEPSGVQVTQGPSTSPELLELIEFESAVG